MIIDLISNIDQYKVLGERIAKAIDFIKQAEFAAMENGKHEIDGKDIFVAISEYDSKTLENAKPETHKNYIDIQIVVSGKEQMGYAPFIGQTSSIPYNPEKDVAFFKVPTNLVEMHEGMFAIFFPQDIHQPGVQLNGPEKIKKAVVKVAV